MEDRNKEAEAKINGDDDDDDSMGEDNSSDSEKSSDSTEQSSSTTSHIAAAAKNPGKKNLCIIVLRCFLIPLECLTNFKCLKVYFHHKLVYFIILRKNFVARLKKKVSFIS
jgi:hypothetical protein